MITSRDMKVFVAGFVTASTLGLIIINASLSFQTVIANAIGIAVEVTVVILVLSFLFRILLSFFHRKAKEPTK